MKKIIVQENFLQEENLKIIENSLMKDLVYDQLFIDKFGVFKGEEVSRQKWLDKNSETAQIILEKFQNLDKKQKHVMDSLQLLIAYKPYDVHSDFYVTQDQKILEEHRVFEPSYTLIIPLSNFSQTIVFDQEACYNNFSDYKKVSKILENHVSDDDWTKFLSHCHKEDQKFLSIKTIFKWKRGNLLAFDRKLFHASSNFVGIKKALIIWLYKSF